MPPRSVEEIAAYATRLHAIDPGSKEPIPVSPEEAYEVQLYVMRTKGYAERSMFDMQLLWHKLLVL